MASCENQRKLSAYHDGELSAALAAEMEKHLLQCPSCREELRRLRAMSVLLASAIDEQAPPEATARWKRSVRPARDRAVLRMTGMLSAAAAAILLVCSTMLWQQSGKPTGLPPRAATWESVAARTTSGPAVALAGELTGAAETPPDIQLANAILADSSVSKGGRP